MGQDTEEQAEYPRTLPLPLLRDSPAQWQGAGGVKHLYPTQSLLLRRSENIQPLPTKPLLASDVGLHGQMLNIFLLTFNWEWLRTL